LRDTCQNLTKTIGTNNKIGYSIENSRDYINLGGFNLGKNNWVFEMPDTFTEAQRILKKMTSTFEKWNSMSRNFLYLQNITGTVAAIESYQSALENIIPMDTVASLLTSMSSAQSILAGIHISKTIDLIPTIERALPQIDDKWRMPTIDWNWMSKTLSTYDEKIEQDEESTVITEDICEKLDESIREIMISDKSEETVKSEYLEWQKRHPALAFLLLNVLIAIIINVVSGVIVNWVTGVLTKKSNLYEEATATSNVLVNIDADQNITIVNEVPYYYEIIYTDAETGEELRGYVYKANVLTEHKNNTEEAIEYADTDQQ